MHEVDTKLHIPTSDKNRQLWSFILIKKLFWRQIGNNAFKSNSEYFFGVLIKVVGVGTQDRLNSPFWTCPYRYMNLFSKGTKSELDFVLNYYIWNANWNNKAHQFSGGRPPEICELYCFNLHFKYNSSKQNLTQISFPLKRNSYIRAGPERWI